MGKDCSESINDCLPTSCKNGGTCVVGRGTRKEEPRSYLKHFSTIMYATIIMLSLFYFMQDLLNAFTCMCADGYTGVDCGIDINECDLTSCENGGFCTVSAH